MTVCIRCKVEKGVLLSHGVVSCSSCNRQNLVQRLRKGLEASRGSNNRPKDPIKVLLAYSGGPASSALLDIFESTYCPADKEGDVYKRYDRLQVVHIGDGDEVRGLTTSKNVDYHEIQPHPTDEGLDQTDRLMAVDTAITTQVIQFARDHTCQIILFGDCANRSAHRVLTLIASGQGDQLERETGLTWRVDIGDGGGQSAPLVICRPFREIYSKEIHHHLYTNSIPFQSEDPTSSSPSSIQTTTRDFLDSLQTTFPSTPLTILATAQKLGRS